MYQFFVSPEQINDRSVTIIGSDVNHIKNVLRMKSGDEISVFNGIDAKEYRCGIEEIFPDKIVCKLRFIKEADHELPSKIYLFQGLPKADKMETIIQKNVELGVYEIIPVNMKRCVARLDDKKAPQKIKRWQGISESAAKQSRRGIIPQIMTPMSFNDALLYAKEKCEILLLPYEMAENMNKTKELLSHITPDKSIALFIGPEGGFEDDEISAAISTGFQTFTLGRRILRTETAGMSVMSILMYLLES